VGTNSRFLEWALRLKKKRKKKRQGILPHLFQNKNLHTLRYIQIPIIIGIQGIFNGVHLLTKSRVVGHGVRTHWRDDKTSD